MKKKRKNEQGTGDFRHNPFKTLKGFSAKEPSPAKKAAPAAAPQDAADESEQFLRAVGGVRRTGVHEPRGGTAKPAPHEPNRGEAAAESDRTLFLKAMGTIGTAAFRDAMPEEEEEGRHRSFTSRMRRLKRGTIKISEELDLHGFLKEEALRRLGHFIAGAYAQRRQAVLVITGKGINSPEGPVLQGAVKAWLREQGKGMVAEFAPAPRDKGGSGAFVVFLKSK